MKLRKPISGILTIEFTSAAPEKTLDLIAAAKIILSHVIKKEELTFEIQIRRSDYKSLVKILHKQGDSWRIIQKQGLYLAVKMVLYRPVLFITFLLLLAISIYLPSRIFFISVEGNHAISDRKILTAAEDCGIKFAASRKLVRSEKVKNALLSAVPQLQWAGINTYGCTAVISVRERAEEMPSDEKIVSNLIADQDGYILSAIVTRGTPHFVIGEAVTKGQLLISGYTDCGLCIRASRSEGEILAQTSRKLTTVLPQRHAIPVTSQNTNYQISLLLGKKRINLWKDSRILEASCGRMYEEYYVSLPGGFQLPIAICIDRYLPYEIQEATISEDDARIQLLEFSEKYISQQMIAGQVLQKYHFLTCSDGFFQLTSNFTCTEIIGKEQREQIGVINGKRD